MPVCSVFGMGFPRGMKPFKGILKADESLLFQGWQKYNSHVVISAYTNQRSSFKNVLSIEVESLLCQPTVAERLQSI